MSEPRTPFTAAEWTEAMRSRIATLERRSAELEALLWDAEAFICVMFGNPDGKIPPTIRTPIGVSIKVGAIMDDIRAALAPAATQPQQKGAVPETASDRTSGKSSSGRWTRPALSPATQPPSDIELNRDQVLAADALSLRLSRLKFGERATQPPPDPETA